MTTFDKHQLRIAHQTLATPDSVLDVMGGMTKLEAEKIIHEERQRIKRNQAARARHAAYTSLGMKRTPYGYE
jgi:hypothetical protein